MAATKRKIKAKKATKKKTSIKVKKTKSKGGSTKSTSTQKTINIKPISLKRTDRPMTKGQQISYLAECAGISRAQASAVLSGIQNLITGHLRGPGELSLGGIIKAKLRKRPATKARKGINPFTGEETMFKAKPASNVVKLLALKRLKTEVNN